MNFSRLKEFLPKSGFIAYFYLLYLIPLLFDLYPFSDPIEWVMLILLVFFVKIYLSGFSDKYQTDRTLLYLLLISVIFTLYNGFASLFVYPGWLFSFWEINSKTFRKYLLWYYSFAGISSVTKLLLNTEVFNNNEGYWITFGLAFIVVSPIIARAIALEQERVSQLATDNSRLKTIIQQNERDRIARDLHDSMGQSYSTMTVKAELAAKLVKRNPDQAIQEIQEVAAMSRQNLNQVRQIVADLHERSIASAMIDASNTLKPIDIIIETNDEEMANQWPDKIQYVFADVIKEATTNILRHSGATRVQYSFSEKYDNYGMKINDNGKGFVQNQNKGFGLKGIQHRVASFAGDLTIESQNGTTLVIQIPKKDVVKNDMSSFEEEVVT